jgi:hypothetical protein
VPIRLSSIPLPGTLEQAHHTVDAYFDILKESFSHFRQDQQSPASGSRV